MTEKRFVGNFYKGMLVSFYDKVDDKNVNILQMVEIANQVVNENEQLKKEKDGLFLFFMDYYDQLEDELIEIEIKLEERIKELEQELELYKHYVEIIPSGDWND